MSVYGVKASTFRRGWKVEFQLEIQIELDHISQVISDLWGKNKLTSRTGGKCHLGQLYRQVVIFVEY